IAAPPPLLVEIEPRVETIGNPIPPYEAPNGYSNSLRLDPEIQQRLLMYFGRDILQRGYRDFVEYFDRYLMPRARQVDYYEAWLPGNDADTKQRNFERY